MDASVGLEESQEVLRDVFKVFVAANFCGYVASDSEYCAGNGTFLNCAVNLIHKSLEIDYVRPHACLRRPDLLLYLRVNVLDKISLFRCAEEKFFALKVLRIYQLCLETHCSTLEQEFIKLNLHIFYSHCGIFIKELGIERSEILDLITVQSLFDGENKSTHDSDEGSGDFLSRQSFLEWLFINFSVFSDLTLYHKASRFLEWACRFAGIQFDFGGQLGKRTKFQQKSLPQLVLKITTVDTNKSCYPPLKTVKLPASVQNKDDTVLENVKLDLEEPNWPHLCLDQVGCLLAATSLIIKQDPLEILRLEQIDALCSNILSREIGFLMSMAVFQLRSEAESRNTRRVERACSQMESLVDWLENRQNAQQCPSEMRLRVQDFFVAFPAKPFWKVKKLYAKVLMSLALTSEAIGVYESIQDWKSVIEGYQALNMKEKALHILENLRNQHPNDPYYLTLIGEIRRDETLLKKVLSLSNDKYVKAHKALGMMAMEAKDYNKAFVHYKRVFELMPLSLQSAYNYGVAAWEINQMKDAIAAFHHVVCVDPEHYKAWNNLSAAYLATNQKARAVMVLKQGLQAYRENYKMWANLYEIAAELPSKRDCFFAVRQMLTFKQFPAEFNVQPLLKILLTHTNAAAGTYYPAPPLQSLLPETELKSLVDTFDEVHKNFTLDAMTLRLVANLHVPTPDESDPSVFEKYIELVDLAEKREMTFSRAKPDYLNTIGALLHSYDARLRLAELKSQPVPTAKKLMLFRLRPLIASVERDFGDKLADHEELQSVVVAARQLLAELK